MKRGVLWLAARHALAERWTSLILVLAIGVAAFLPFTIGHVFDDYEERLRSRAENTPRVLGPDGHRFDLTLAALHFRQADLPDIRYGVYETRLRKGGGQWIPLFLRFQARGQHPIIGTTPEYFEQRGLRMATGERPLILGEAMLGATVADKLGLGVGERLHSDPIDAYDITKPSSVRMKITGILAPTGTSDDDAIFVDVRTTWMMTGLLHGHGATVDLPDRFVIGRDGEAVALSGAVIEYAEVTPETIDSFHIHGELADMPLTALLFWPQDRKAATLTRSEVNTRTQEHMLRPADIIDELITFVLQLKTLLDAIAGLVAVVTLALGSLVLALSLRIRRGEIATLHRIGGGRFLVLRLIGYELALLFAAGIALGFGASRLALAVLPDLVRSL